MLLILFVGYFFVREKTYSLCSAARSRCRRFLNQLETCKGVKIKIQFMTNNKCHLSTIFLTCVVVSPVASAKSRFSRGDGYGLCAYQSLNTERDFS